MRKLFFYTKQQFFNFKAMQTAAGFKLLSMSQLLSNQKVGELNKNQKYYVDLSSVMGYTKTNDSQQMLFEQLFDSFGENIDFICDKMYEEDIKYIFRYILYGDNVFEKDGIRRDRTGDGEKTRCLCGKRGIFNRDGPAMGPQIIRQLE